jgi:hypothetical protein
MIGVTFDLSELMTIESRLSPSEVSASRDRESLMDDGVPSRDLILKVGLALLEAKDQAAATIHLTSRELWTLRERVHIADAIGKRDAGYQVKLKLYYALREVEAAAVYGMMRTIEVNEPTIGEVRDALEQREFHGTAGKDSGKDPDGSA